MKPKSISALVYKVVDMDKTVAWYEGLGFRVDGNDGRTAKVYVNWFSAEFHLAGDIDDSPKDGPQVLVSVDINDFYKSAVAAGYQPEAELEDYGFGRREFSLRDPNGYLMVFFEKK